MTYEIHEKAWVLDNSNLDEPWFHNDDIVYYGTRGQAKAMAVPDNNGGKLSNGGEINFMTIKVRRSVNNDKIIVDGKIIKRSELSILHRKEQITKLPKDKMYYVQDRRSYIGNAMMWWGLDNNGYVTDITRAQKYTWDEIQEFDPRDSDIIWQAEHVETAIRQYIDSQYLDREFSV